MAIPAVILAAGFSSRMGRDKALLPVPGGGWFLSRLAGTLSLAGCPEVIAVAGPATVERVDAAANAEGLRLRLLVNPDPSRGQLSSLHIAIDALGESKPEGLLVCPVDQPLVAPRTVALLLERWRAGGAAIARPSRGGRHGHPVIFGASILPELRRAPLADGARPVVRAHAHEVLDVEVDDDAGAFEDIDTPDDYLRVFGVPLSAAEAARS